MPQISVVMSVFNGERYLREAIDSILEQTFADFEFIIIDDGSTDSSAGIMRSYADRRIRVIQQKNRGLSAALNVGLNAAQGWYIARMDADDVSLPYRLEIQYEFMEAHPECVAVGSKAIVIDADGEYLFTSDQPTSWKEIRRLLPRTPFYHSSTMFRKDAAIQCGGYFEAIRHFFEDVIFFNQLARIGELRNLPRPLIKYRLVPSALSNIGSKYSLVLEISERIIERGTISAEERRLVERMVKVRSKRWKESSCHLRIGKIFLEYNFHRKKAIRNFVLSIGKYPFNGISWFNLFLSLLPRTVIHRWKGWRNRRYDECLRDGRVGF